MNGDLKASRRSRSPGICAESSELLQALPEADRCSFEHLAEAEKTSEELVTPTYTEAVRFSCENSVSMRGVRADTCSPVASVALTPFKPLPAFLSQAHYTSQPSYKLVGLLARYPGQGDCKWRPIKIASLMNVLNIGMRSPETKTGILQLVSRPGDVWTSVSCSLSAEFEWRACWKLLNMTISARQYLYDVISAIVTRSATGHPLRARTGFVPVLEPNLALAGRRCFPKRLYSLISMIVAQNLSMLRELNQMEPTQLGNYPTTFKWGH